MELVKKGIKLKYRRSYLGVLWTMLEPLLTMVVLTLVFGKLFGRTDPTFPVYILTGRLLYTFFANSTKAAMKSIQSNSSMIKKVYVPKYIYPLSSILSNFVIFLISLIVLVGVGMVLRVEPTIYILFAWVPLVILLIMVFGIGLILATLTVFFRDLEYLWGVALMLIMYSSAIFYPVDRLINTNTEWILKLNPLYAVIINFRNTVLYGQPLDLYYLTFSAAFSLVTVLIGLIMFYRQQDKFILHL